MALSSAHLVLGALLAALTLLSSTSALPAVAVRDPALPSCVCNTLVAATPICCQLPSGHVYTSTVCECTSCDGGSVVSDRACPCGGSCAGIKCTPGFHCVERPSGPICIREEPPEPSPSPPVDCRCRRKYAPVCCDYGDGVFETRDNKCICKHCGRGGRVSSRRPCPTPEPCNCNKKLDPACCQRPDGTVFTASNSCTCKCEEGSVVSKSLCATTTPPTTCACDDEYDPVCCVLGDGSQISLGNTCKCEKCNKGDVLYPGRCTNTCRCPEIFEPTCCRGKDGSLFTTDNSCLCECQGGTAGVEGCATTVPTTTAPGPCICTLEYAPVCCLSEDGNQFTAGNTCACEKCGRGKVLYDGECNSGCECPEIYAPTCCRRRDGSLFIADNDCFCECVGGTPDAEGCPTTTPPTTTPRPCACTLEFAPVCCEQPDGTRETKSNRCFCDLCGTGGDVINEGECDSPGDCVCPEIYDPACCRRKNGELFTASNKCFCECEGTIVSRGECPTTPPTSTAATTESTPCACPPEFNPVCCDLGDGIRETRTNQCECETCSAGDVQSQGQCIVEGACICPSEPNPVCCLKRDGTFEIAGNSCLCSCVGEVVDADKCPSTSAPTTTTSDCVCTAEFSPVCCQFADGSTRTESNQCFCEQCGAGGEVISPGQCSVPGACVCSDIVDPTCCRRPSGSPFFATNPCTCRCEGEVLDAAECEGIRTEPPSVSPSPPAVPDDCVCTTEFAPVCCDLLDGRFETRTNACECEECGEGGRIASRDKC